MQVTGTLRTIKSKSGVSARGPWTAYSLGVDTGDGSLSWFRYGFDAPQVTEGSYIAFAASEDKPGQFKVTGEVTIDKSKPAAAKAYASGLSGSAKDNSIVRQNATGHAARIVSDMVTHGIIVLPKTKGKLFDIYMDYVTEVTNRIFLSNINAASAEDIIAASAIGDTPADALDDDPWASE